MEQRSLSTTTNQLMKRPHCVLPKSGARKERKHDSQEGDENHTNPNETKDKAVSPMCVCVCFKKKHDGASDMVNKIIESASNLLKQDQ